MAEEEPRIVAKPRNEQFKDQRKAADSRFAADAAASKTEKPSTIAAAVGPTHVSDFYGTKIKD